MTETLNYSGRLLFEDVLRSEGSVSSLEQYIDTLLASQPAGQILLLGHQPLIGPILEYLTDETGLAWSMGTSAFATLEAPVFGRGCAEVKSLAQPHYHKTISNLSVKKTHCVLLDYHGKSRV